MSSLTHNSDLAAGTPAETSAPPRRGRLLRIGLGSFTLLVSVALIGGAIAGIFAITTSQDSTGFFTTHSHRYQTSTYALSTESLNVGGIVGDLESSLVRLRITAASANAAKPLFIGIAPTQDITRYLAGVKHDELRNIRFNPFSIDYRHVGAGGLRARPNTQTFWRVRAIGTGTQTITWPVTTGQWSAVVMNADGTSNIAVDAQLAARVAGAWWFVAGAFALGALALIGGIALVRTGTRTRPDTSTEIEEV